MALTSKEETRFSDLETKMDETVSRVDILETQRDNDKEQLERIEGGVKSIDGKIWAVLIVLLGGLLASILALLTK